MDGTGPPSGARSRHPGQATVRPHGPRRGSGRKNFVPVFLPAGGKGLEYEPMYIGPLGDPWVQAEVDKAMKPYKGRLPAEEIAWMRERLLEALATERVGRDLLRRARPRYVEESGEVGRDGRLTTASSARAESSAKKAGGRRGGGR